MAEASDVEKNNSCNPDDNKGAYSLEPKYQTTDCSHSSKSRNNLNQNYSKNNQNNNDHRLNRKTYENSQLNVNAPCFTSAYNQHNFESESNISHRGAIIGGRYIRKHTSHSVEHPQSNIPNYENLSCEQNYSSPPAHRSGNSSNNMKYRGGSYVDSDARQISSKSLMDSASSTASQATSSRYLQRMSSDNLDTRRQFHTKNSDYMSRSSNEQRPNGEDTRRQFHTKNSDYMSRSSNEQKSNGEDTRKQFSSKPSRYDNFSRSSHVNRQRVGEDYSDLRRQNFSKPSRSNDSSMSSHDNGQRLNDDEFNSGRYSSKPLKNTDYNSQLSHSNGHRLTESDSDFRRQFHLKTSKHSNYSSKYTDIDSKKLTENSYSSNSVSNYSSSSGNEKRTSENNRASNQSYEIDANQRELLIQQLNKGDYECLVCCDRIRVRDQIWHCVNCYHVFHLRCIRKWARSPAASVPGEGWRCPACQNATQKVPFDYFCFCGAHKNPDVNYHLTPHTCGEICGRNPPDCSHPCKEFCHPGPCPPCSVVVQKSCACSKTIKALPCKQDVELTCTSICEKALNCGMHRCAIPCHPGECPLCAEEIHQVCYCKKSEKTVVCDSDSSGVLHFSCGDVCGRLLCFGNHSCESICHPGDCKPCKLSTEVVKYCPCGKTSFQELISTGKAVERKSCKDPIPLCNKICEKTFFCGPKGMNCSGGVMSEQMTEIPGSEILQMEKAIVEVERPSNDSGAPPKRRKLQLAPVTKSIELVATAAKEREIDERLAREKDVSNKSEGHQVSKFSSGLARDNNDSVPQHKLPVPIQQIDDDPDEILTDDQYRKLWMHHNRCMMGEESSEDDWETRSDDVGELSESELQSFVIPKFIMDDSTETESSSDDDQDEKVVMAKETTSEENVVQDWDDWEDWMSWDLGDPVPDNLISLGADAEI